MAEERNRLEEIKKRLFSRDPNAVHETRRGKLDDMVYPAERTWHSENSSSSQSVPVSESMTKKRSPFKTFFIGSLVFFGIAAIFALFNIFSDSRTVSSNNIDIVVLGNGFTDGGETLGLDVDIQNKNTAALEYVDLIITYPRGDDADPAQQERKRISVGTVAAGKTKTQHVDLILYGAQGTTKNISFTLEYHIAGSNAIFSKNIIYPVIINAAPVTLTVAGPTAITPGQSFTLDISVLQNATVPAKNMLVRVEYPPSFSFQSAVPAAMAGNNIFEIGDLGPGMTKKVSIKGKLEGIPGEERSFRIYTGAGASQGQTDIAVAYSSLLHTMTLENPFINAQIMVGGVRAEQYAITGGQSVPVSIAWTNNLPTSIDDVVINAKLSGNALNQSSVQAQSGFYDSNTNTISWNKNTFSQFASLDPGASGMVGFSVASLLLVGGGQSLLVNPTILVSVSVTGRQPNDGGTSSQITTSDERELRVSTGFFLAGRGLRTIGAFTNTGPVPPKVGNRSTYTIEWTVSNSANPVTGAVAVATLPPYVEWAGRTAPESESLSYNEITREVTWNIGTVNAGVGIQGGGRTASFQVAITPSLSQVGSTLSLVGETKLTGTDSFSHAALQSIRPLINTRILNDPAYQNNWEKVVN